MKELSREKGDSIKPRKSFKASDIDVYRETKSVQALHRVG